MKIPMNLKYIENGKGMKEAFVALASLPIEEFECGKNEIKFRRYLDSDKISEFLSARQKVKIELEWIKANGEVEGFIIGK